MEFYRVYLPGATPVIDPSKIILKRPATALYQNKLAILSLIIWFMRLRGYFSVLAPVTQPLCKRETQASRRKTAFREALFFFR